MVDWANGQREDTAVAALAGCSSPWLEPSELRGGTAGWRIAQKPHKPTIRRPVTVKRDGSPSTQEGGRWACATTQALRHSRVRHTLSDHGIAGAEDKVLTREIGGRTLLLSYLSPLFIWPAQFNMVIIASCAQQGDALMRFVQGTVAQHYDLVSSSPFLSLIKVL